MLATALFVTSVATTAEGKPNRGSEGAEQAFAKCNTKRNEINDSMRPIRMAIIIATHPEYFRLHTVQEGDTWNSLYKSNPIPDCFTDLMWELNDVRGLNNANAAPPLITGTQVVLPSDKAKSDWTTNQEASAIIVNYRAPRAIPCDLEWNLGEISAAEYFDDKVISCVTETETKGTDLNLCITNADLFTEFLDTNVVSCEEPDALGSVSRCQKTIKSNCRRAMKTCDTKLQGDANALVYLRVAHDKLTSQRLKTHGERP